MTQIYKTGQLPGTFLGMRHLPDLTLGHNLFQAHQPAPRHAHEHADLCLIVAGSCQERSGHRSLDLKPFTLAFHPAGEGHDGVAGTSGTRCFHIELGPSWLARLDDGTLLPNRFTRFEGGDMVWLATRLFREYALTDSFCPLVAEGLVLELLGAIQRCGESGPRYRRPPWLTRVHELLREEWSDAHTMASIANRVGVHPVHLTRTFRRFFDESPGDYLQQIRVRKACEQLLGSEERLAQIASACGFADQSHFTRIFKKWTGTTPLAFRRHREPFNAAPST